MNGTGGVAEPRLRILVVCGGSPTTHGGASERMRVTIGSLALLGSVEVITVSHATTHGAGEAGVLGLPVREVPLLVRRVLPTDYVSAALGWRPRRLAASRFRAQRKLVREALNFRTYDLVWTITDRAFFSLPRESFRAPVVADLVDYEGDRDVELARVSAGRWRPLRVARAKTDRRALRHSIGSIAARANATLVSSEVDRARLGITGVKVLPNFYGREGDPVGVADPKPPTTFLFAGSLGYTPNIDAARWLIDTIWPLIRELEPEARLRIVGRGLRRASLSEPPGVTIVGQVTSMEAELAGAAAVLVPLRVGSGTRIKILEAWAHGIPVVSTTVGAEGLGALHGEHLLIADDPTEFALAAQLLVTNGDARGEMTRRALALFETQFDSRSAERQVRAVVAGALSRPMDGCRTPP